MSRIPNVYRPPYGGPLRWQDDTSGKLPEAVHAFFEVSGAPPLTPERLELVREYCQYYINAPCWKTDGPDQALWTRLREDVQHITAKAAMIHWLEQTIEVTIDPF